MSRDFFEKESKATIVVGGSFGSEGKGAITHHLAMQDDYDIAVRGGSDNAGHTIYHNDKPYKMQDIPVAWTNPKTRIMIAPAAIFSVEQFEKELGWLREAGLPAEGRLIVDRNAGVITQAHIDEEVHLRGLSGKIGSTAHGCGAALAAKLMRDGFKTAKEFDAFKPFIGDVSAELNQALYDGDRAILEGTQGTMLSLNHSPYYPFCTSRDATACAIANEAGIGPQRIGEVVMVVRSYPIRVGGNSGLTAGQELDWTDIAQRSGRHDLVPERTTVTNKQRRIFEWSWEDFFTALRLNSPTQIAVTFADYWNAGDFGARTFSDLSETSQRKLANIQRRAGVPVTLVKTGPKNDHIIDLREKGGI